MAEANAEVIDKTVDGEVSTAASAAEKKEGSDSESEDKELEDPDGLLWVSMVEMGR